MLDRTERIGMGRGKAGYPQYVPLALLADFQGPLPQNKPQVAIVKENDVFVKNAGDYPWGSVQAPGAYV